MAVAYLLFMASLLLAASKRISWAFALLWIGLGICAWIFIGHVFF